MAIVYRLNGKSVSRQQMQGTVDPTVLKDVFESRKFPGINDDTTFMANRGTLEQQLGAEDAEEWTKIARKHGYNPSPNDVYLPSLADFPGDPKAFVKQDGAQGHVRSIMESKGMPCDGMVKTKDNPELRQMTAEKKIPLADDLVEEWAKDAIAKDPSIGEKCTVAEGRQEAAKVHGESMVHGEFKSVSTGPG